VALLDARSDVGDGTSKANNRHPAHRVRRQTRHAESRMVSRGYQLLSDYAGQTGIPVEHTGALLVAWDAEQLDALPTLKAKAEANGYPHCEIVDAPTVYRQVPDLATAPLAG